MFDCCMNNCFDCGPFCNGCPPTNYCCRRSHSTEFPKQCGPFVEEKFSNFNPPSFLCNTEPSKPRVRSKSCSCSSKTPKVSINCKCKEKGITDCRNNGNEAGKRVCEKTCEAKDTDASDNESADQEKSGHGAGTTPHGTHSDYAPGMPGYGPINAVWQGPDGNNPGIPVYDFMGQRNPMNQMPGINQMPAAGLPTRQIPQFDPCTGRELAQQSGQSGAYGMPMTCMYPCYCPIQCYPCPPAMNLCPPMQQGFGQPNATIPAIFNENEDKGERVSKPKSRSISRDRSERTKDERHKSRTLDTDKSLAKEKEIIKASNSRRKDNQQVKLINCSTASPELIERLCDSLQVPRPPGNCYILLPITMASTDKVKDDVSTNKVKSNASVAKTKPDTVSSSADDVIVPAEQIAKKETPPATKASKRTRNCGCNTLISGKFEENSDSAEPYPANNSCCPAAGCNPGAGCSSGCCYRPCYTYCYNPCTGCFYWRKKCCCCGYNGCCTNNNKNNNGCSCPIPKPYPNSGPTSSSSDSAGPTASPPVKRKSLTNPAQGKGLDKDKRFEAGAMTAFQPDVQELYDQWMGFQQQAVLPPMTPPRQQPTFVSSGPIYTRSQSPARDKPQYQSPDIDWTPQ